MMTDQEKQSLNEAKRREKRAAEEIEQLAREQARRKAYLAREQVIEKDQKKSRPSERRNSLLQKFGNYLGTGREETLSSPGRR
jgi:hypothetical protein